MRRSTAAACWRTAAALALCAAPGSAAGQEEGRQVERILRQIDEQERGLRPDRSLAVSERALLDAGGYHTFTFLNENQEAGNSVRLLQYDTSIYARLSLDGAHDAFLRGRFRYQDFSPGDSFNGRGDQWAEPFLDRWWYEFDLRRHAAMYEGRELPWDLTLRAGRQFVDWGAGLVLSEQLYAVRPTLRLGTEWSVEAIAGVTPGDEAVVDFDISRAAYASRTRRGFYGGLLRWAVSRGPEVYGFGLYMADYNDDTEARFGTTDPVSFGYRATYVGVGFTGTLGASIVCEGEGVYQAGQSMSDPLRGPQTAERISAVAARGQVSYLFHDARRSQVQVETVVASGDGDRQLPTSTVGGNLSGTIDRAFNSLGFANTGLAFAPPLSNIVSVRMGFSQFPLADDRRFERLQVGVDTLLFMKFDHAGPIDEPTNSQSYLGTEADLYLNYRALSDLALGVRYGVFVPGAAISEGRDLRHFIMASVTVSF